MSDQTPLQRLYRVQELDLALDRLKAEEHNLPEALQQARAEQDRLNNELEDTEITLEDIEKRLRQHELDLKSIREQITNAQEEQEKNAFDARAQSQYGSRIQQLSERAEELEEELAPLHEQQQELSEKSQSLRTAHRELRPKLNDLEEQDAQRIADLHTQGEDSRKERAEITGALDKRTVKEYNMIRRAKEGKGISEIIAGRCSACNVMLPVNIQQKVSRGNLPPVKCPSCRRFLIRLDWQ